MSGGGPGGACLAQVAVAASSSRRDPMGQLQRTSDPASTTSSQDPPWLGRHERNSLVKNRMREICTSGSGAARLAAIPAGAGPANKRSPVHVVVISSGSEGDQTAGSLDVKALWGRGDLVRSVKGGRATWQAVA